MNKCIVFCADLQARGSVYKHNQELKDDDLVALEQVVRYCNRTDVQCEALILGGDQVDSPRIGDEHVIKLRKILSECSAPVFYIDGNHERGFKRLDLEGGYASVASSLENSPFVFEGREVKGYNWRSRREWEELVESGMPPTDILILHGFADQAAAELGLPASTAGLGDFDINWFDGKCDLCLMGDIHQPMHFEGSKHKTRFYYPGSMWMHRSNEPLLKQFLVIDSDLIIRTEDLETRPFFKEDIYSEEDMSDLLTRVLKSSVPEDVRIQKPRVHIDIYSEENLDKDIELLKRHAFLFIRMKPSKTVIQLEGIPAEPGLISLKETINSVVGKNDKELRLLLNEIFESGEDAATEKLRKRLGVS